MSDIELVIPGQVSTIGTPLYVQVLWAFLLRYSNQLTSRGYQRSLLQWFRFCEGHNLDPLAVKRVHIEAWARWCEANGNQSSTIGGKLNALAGYYRYAYIEEIIDRDPMINVQRPKVLRESKRNGVTRFELIAVLEQAEKDGPRTHALHCLLGFNGFRIGEILGIDIEHLGQEGPYPTVTILRKGGKWETQPLGYRPSYAVKCLVGDRTTGPLFVTRNGRRLLRQQAHRIVVRIAKQAGVTKKVSPHSYRHGFVTMSKNAGIPSRDIMAATGHADERMLSYYDRDKLNLRRSAVHGLEAYVAGAT